MVEFSYLGSDVTSDGRRCTETVNETNQAEVRWIKGIRNNKFEGRIYVRRVYHGRLGKEKRINFWL